MRNKLHTASSRETHSIHDVAQHHSKLRELCRSWFVQSRSGLERQRAQFSGLSFLIRFCVLCSAYRQHRHAGWRFRQAHIALAVYVAEYGQARVGGHCRFQKGVFRHHLPLHLYLCNPKRMAIETPNLDTLLIISKSFDHTPPLSSSSPVRI